MAKVRTSRQAEKTLLGVPNSVLAHQWLEAFYSGEEYQHLLPWDFRNRPQLPTKRQLLLLYFFYRGEFKNKTKLELMKMVINDLKKLWNMAGIAIVGDKIKNKTRGLQIRKGSIS